MGCEEQKDTMLKENEELYRQMFEGNRAVKLLVDPGTFCILDANQAAADFYGYDRDTLKRMKILDLNVLTLDQIRERMSDAETYKVSRFIFQHRLRSGEIRDVEVCSSPLHLQGKQVLYSIIHDITEGNRAAQELRETQEKYAALFANVRDAIILVDAAHFNILDCNNAAVELYGYSKDEFLTKKLMDISPEMEGELKDHRQEDSRTTSGTLLRYHAKKDGTLFPVEITNAVLDLKGGKVVCGIIRDITDRKSAEEALAAAYSDLEQRVEERTAELNRKNEQLAEEALERTKAEEALRISEGRYRQLFEDAPMMYVITRDKQGAPLIEDCNSTFLRSLGYTFDEVRGEPLAKFYSSESRVALLEGGGYRHALAGEYFCGERELVHRSGAVLSTLLYTTALTDPAGLVTGTRAMYVDISERNKAEREKENLNQQLLQSQKMESLGTLAGGIAHDFNNLLTIILGFSECVLSEKKPGDADYEDLNKVVEASRGAGELVQQILAFSRKTESQPRPFNLNEGIERLRKMLSRLISKTIEVEMSLDTTIPMITADPTQLEQVLMNLAVNARDAMPEGGTLRIATETVLLDEVYCQSHIDACEGRNILLTVSDTGSGIDPDLLDRIFEPFYTTKARGEGTGLGLSMVYRIIKSHGGHVLCESELGKGTTFKMYLPERPFPEQAKVTTTPDLSTTATGTILLVDDELLVRSLARRVLEKAGYTVITAEDGQEAIEIYKRKGEEISLIILDLIMPVMNGKRCFEEVLRLDPSAKIIIASGFAPEESTKELLERGAKDFVPKPYKVNNLLTAVRDVLKGDGIDTHAQSKK